VVRIGFVLVFQASTATVCQILFSEVALAYITLSYLRCELMLNANILRPLWWIYSTSIWSYI